MRGHCGVAARLALRMLARRRLAPDTGARVALTLDDGPHPHLGPRWLDAFARHGVRATFFVSGQACELRPDLVARMLAAGHEVANHGHAHFAPTEASAAEYVADVRRTQRVIEGIAGGPLPRRFRPPYGRLGLRAQLELRQLGYEIVLWSADANDSFDRDPDTVSRNVLTSVRERDIVLMHEDAPWSLEALPAILRGLSRRGLRAVPLGAATPDGGSALPRTVQESAR